MSVNQKVLDAFVEDFWNDSVEEEFENFFRNESPKFIQSTAEQRNNEAEHNMEYYNSYQRFIELTEKKLEEFLGKHTISKEEFYNMCEQIQNDESGQYEEHQFLVNLLLATTEYDNFFQLMQDQAIQLQQERKFEDEDDREDREN